MSAPSTQRSVYEFPNTEAPLQTVTCLIELLAMEPYYRSSRTPELL